jgi:microsomal prostaglandin-E synthase 2
MKPKLFQYAACPFCSKVRMILKYKGVDYDTIEVHPLNKKEIQFSKDYQAVPIYIDTDGKQHTDSTPIMRSIDDEFPTPKVFHKDPAEARREEEWLNWSNAFVKGLPTAIYDSIGNALKSFDYITKIGKFGWFEKRTIKYLGAFVMTLVSKKIKKREKIDDPNQFLRDKTREWVTGLNGRSFMGGGVPNGSDIAVFGICQSVAGLKAGETLEENSAFKAWLERMNEQIGLSKELLVSTA